MTGSHLRGHAAMLLFSILVAGSFIFGVRVAILAEPAAINSVRFFIAAGLIGFYLIFSASVKMADMKRLMIAPWRFVLLAAVFSSYFIFMFEGLKTAATVSSSAIFTLIPVMSALFGYILLRQRVTKRMGMALLIGSIGAMWVVFKADLSNLLAFDVGEGEFVYFLGCVAHALFIPMSRMLNWGEKPIVTTFAILVCGGAIMGAYGFKDIMTTDWLHMPPIFWAGLLFLAVFASAVTFFLLQYAALLLPSAKVMAYNFLTPVWVILVEVIMGYDWPPAVIFVGIGMTVVALILLLKDEAPKVEAIIKV